MSYTDADKYLRSLIGNDCKIIHHYDDTVIVSNHRRSCTKAQRRIVQLLKKKLKKLWRNQKNNNYDTTRTTTPYIPPWNVFNSWVRGSPYAAKDYQPSVYPGLGTYAE